MPGGSEGGGAPATSRVNPGAGGGAPVQISSLSHEGRGVARPGGKATFIDGALPGESVSFRYARRRRSYDEAVAVDVLNPSPHRVTPICRHYTLCGGCSLQHLAHAEQLRHKEAVLFEHLDRVAGGGDLVHLPPVTGPVRAYRRRARLGVRHVASRRGVLVGFHERRSSRVADIEHCEILHSGAAELLRPLEDLISGLAHPDTIPQVEVASGEEGVALVIRHLKPFPAEDHARLREFETARRVQIYLQPGGEDSVQALTEAPGDGLCYRLPEFDLEFRFGPLDFTQVNFDVNARMVSRALELLEPGPGDRVLDLYCGIGNFTLPLARRAAWAGGVEGSAKLVERAQANARLNNVENASFAAADLARVDVARCFPGTAFNKILLDPPRAGAGDLLGSMDLKSVSRLLYVSCNPATLARDAGQLVAAHGFRLRRAGVVDMFPHTAHVEAMALFERA